MLDWDDMRVFLGVARARSLSGAAPGLRMDPATVGRRIARLEEARQLEVRRGFAAPSLPEQRAAEGVMRVVVDR